MTAKVKTIGMSGCSLSFARMSVQLTFVKHTDPVRERGAVIQE
jgi:hypothetical protein